MNKFKDKEFLKKYLKEYRQRPEAKAKHRTLTRRARLKRIFGITPEQYDIILNNQGGVCKICKNPETLKHHKTGTIPLLAIDHCHKTNTVRGILCAKCNTGIGSFRDDINLLKSAIFYLEESSSISIESLLNLKRSS
jgi:hypothetical protein